MELRVGDLYAECPYCGSTEFRAAEADSHELVCARCEGYASREVILERLKEPQPQKKTR